MLGGGVRFDLIGDDNCFGNGLAMIQRKKKKARAGDLRGWHSRLEQLEARQMLAATVAIEPVLPQFRNEALDRVEIEFSEPVSGFDVGDLILTIDGDAGVQRIDLAGVAQLTNVGNRSFTLRNLASLTGDDGDYQFTLDVINSGIKDAQGQPLAFEGTGLGPECASPAIF